jgi:hypothetical protein
MMRLLETGIVAHFYRLFPHAEIAAPLLFSTRLLLCTIVVDLSSSIHHARCWFDRLSHLYTQKTLALGGLEPPARPPAHTQATIRTLSGRAGQSVSKGVSLRRPFANRREKATSRTCLTSRWSSSCCRPFWTWTTWCLRTTRMPPPPLPWQSLPPPPPPLPSRSRL